MVEAILSLKIDELQLKPDQIARITPDTIKMFRERVTFRELSRLWGIERDGTIVRDTHYPQKRKIYLSESEARAAPPSEDWL